jgi:predicted dithiol-disulfide oxidoreductase (DUF899 family)
MTSRRIGTREEWVAAGTELLKREKEHTRAGDELAKSYDFSHISTAFADAESGAVVKPLLSSDREQLGTSSSKPPRRRQATRTC